MTLVPNRRIRVLVVDDEAPARKGLMDLLRKDSDVAEILEAPDGIAAVELIQKEKPDLVLLDVQMPEVNGFSVIDALGPEQMPLTIFVTAHDQYAVQAFGVDAVDYLLKPVEDERFERAMARAKSQLALSQYPRLGENIMRLAAERALTTGYLDRLVVKTRGVTQFVAAAEIDWIGAAGAYSALHIQGMESLCRLHLRELADRLDPTRFFRIHRSTIINIRRVAQLEPVSHGDFEVLMKDGARLCLSRTYRGDLEKRLGQIL
jgi:two-component system LytT family response regulator